MARPSSTVETRGNVRVWRSIQPTPVPTTSHKVEHRVVIVGTGPVGLALAIDLGQRGHEVLVLGKFDFIPDGSKAICFSKRSLDILDRLKVGEQAVERGVTWNVGKVFWKDSREPIYQFDLLPVKNQKMPGFINLQQYYLEDLLIGRISQLPNVEVGWGHEVTEVSTSASGAKLGVKAEGGDYVIESEWVVACDGSKSTIRNKLGLDFEGRVFEDNFLIADVRMKGDFPAERWFWFDPPFNPGKSVLLHKQPDDIWRIDFQLGWDIDREACIRAENVNPLVKAMLGDDVEFEREWYSVYTFQCRRMARFVHGRAIFAGDSAHLVSPFGARGCNGGLADIDNLGWKLDLVLRGDAPEELLETYNHEAITTADENILNSTRSTDFLTPKSTVSTAFRDAVLDLAGVSGFARAFVNSGRLSTAVSYPDGPLNSPDEGDWSGGVASGSPLIDAPLDEGWLLEKLGGRFVVLSNGGQFTPLTGVDHIDLAKRAKAQIAIERLDLRPGSAYLIRPDQYVAARFRTPNADTLTAALNRSSRGVSA